MSLALYMDENVHGAITNGLRQRQVNVLTVQEDHRSGMSDSEVLDRATELERVLFSQDDDLLAEAKLDRLRKSNFQECFLPVNLAFQLVRVFGILS